MTDDIPWPKEGDVLFGGADDFHNAFLADQRVAWEVFAEGYKRGADRLVQHVIEAQRDHNFLVYPIVFLYRHAIELMLKRILLLGSQLLGRECKISHTHPLDDFWDECRKIIEEVWPGGPKEDLDAVEQVIRQLNSKDHRSTAFRYPAAPDPAKRPSNDLINLKNFAEVANRTFSLLEACLCGITDYHQKKLEHMHFQNAKDAG